MVDTKELLGIADTVERNGGWHIAAVKIRGFVEDYDALAAELAAKERALTDTAVIAQGRYDRIAALEAALESISNGEGAGGLAETERLQEIARAALTPQETSEAMRARIVTETADAITKERGLTSETPAESPDKALGDDVREAVQLLASHARGLPMGTWCGIANTLLHAADRLSPETKQQHEHLWSGVGPDAYCVGCCAPKTKGDAT